MPPIRYWLKGPPTVPREAVSLRVPGQGSGGSGGQVGSPKRAENKGLLTVPKVDFRGR